MNRRRDNINSTIHITYYPEGITGHQTLEKEQLWQMT